MRTRVEACLRGQRDAYLPILLGFYKCMDGFSADGDGLDGGGNWEAASFQVKN